MYQVLPCHKIAYPNGKIPAVFIKNRENNIMGLMNEMEKRCVFTVYCGVGL